MDTRAKSLEGVVVVTEIPIVKLLVQTIQPIRRGWHEANPLLVDIRRHKSVDRMADEQIRQLDLLPEIAPDLILRASLFVNQITAELNVRPENDWNIRTESLDDGNQPRHLMVVNDDNISSSLRRERAPGKQPLRLGIALDPVVAELALLFRKTNSRIGNTLKDVVVVFCGPKHTWIRLWDIPARNIVSGPFAIISQCISSGGLEGGAQELTTWRRCP